MSTELISSIKINRSAHTSFVRVEEVEVGEESIWVSLRSTDIPARVEVKVVDSALVLDFRYDPPWDEPVKRLRAAKGALVFDVGDG